MIVQFPVGPSVYVPFPRTLYVVREKTKLSSRRSESTLWLIDGDTYEERNKERVLFQEYENKALTKARELTVRCGNGLPVLPVPRYVGRKSVRRLIEENDIVFLCVDNHATRRLVSNRCRSLREAVLFSGGNDGIEQGQRGTFGNVQIYIRHTGRDVTNPLTRFHPEIAQPKDKSPDSASCAELALKAGPQLLFTNMAVASAMLGSFYAWLGGELGYEEIYLDILTGKMIPVTRAVRPPCA